MNYKSMIDKLLSQIEQETTSAHELTTKLCNIEYYTGQLYKPRSDPRKHDRSMTDSNPPRRASWTA